MQNQVQPPLWIALAVLATITTPGCSKSSKENSSVVKPPVTLFFQESEPNDDENNANVIGTVLPTTTILIKGTTGPADLDVFEIDSSDFLGVSFSLKPSCSNCDIDLFLFDVIFAGILIDEFAELPPPVTETGFFEMQPGNFFQLAIFADVTTTYELEITFLNQNPLTISPADESKERPLSPDKLSLSNRVQDMIKGPKPVTMHLERLDVIDTSSERIEIWRLWQIN